MPPPRTLLSKDTPKRRRSVIGSDETPRQRCTCSNSCLVRTVMCGAATGTDSGVQGFPAGRSESAPQPDREAAHGSSVPPAVITILFGE